MFDKIKRKLYAKFLPYIFRYPNVHTGKNNSRILNLPFCRNKVIIRRTRSDISRVCEYINEIYTADGYLSVGVQSAKPTVLIDIGSNIGLSSLSLIQKFPSIKTVVGIEAESLNFEILKENFKLWGAQYQDITFVPKNMIASSESDVSHTITKLSDDANLTASGTFRFERNNASETGVKVKSIAVQNLLKEYSSEQLAIVKIDIEGGEYELFEKNCDWLNQVVFMTIELHDRYDPKLIDTSKNVITALAQYDFALLPSQDVLHCFNRKLIRSCA